MEVGFFRRLVTFSPCSHLGMFRPHCAKNSVFLIGATSNLTPNLWKNCSVLVTWLVCLLRSDGVLRHSFYRRVRYMPSGELGNSGKCQSSGGVAPATQAVVTCLFYLDCSDVALRCKLLKSKRKKCLRSFSLFNSSCPLL